MYQVTLLDLLQLVLNPLVVRLRLYLQELLNDRGVTEVLPLRGVLQESLILSELLGFSLASQVLALEVGWYLTSLAHHHHAALGLLDRDDALPVFLTRVTEETTFKLRLNRGRLRLVIVEEILIPFVNTR